MSEESYPRKNQNLLVKSLVTGFVGALLWGQSVRLVTSCLFRLFRMRVLSFVRFLQEAGQKGGLEN